MVPRGSFSRWACASSAPHCDPGRSHQRLASGEQSDWGVAGADCITLIDSAEIMSLIIQEPALRRSMTRVAYLLVLMGWLQVQSEAQQTESSAHSELWPEVDIFAPINEKWRLVFSTSVTRAEETREKQEFQVGARVDYSVNKALVLGAGYSYRHSPGDNPSSEHRVLANQTLRQSLPLRILLSDRNREEIRVIDGNSSFRYRNQLTLEREFRLGERSITPYASVEVFHDSRFGVWNRNRLTAGVQIPLKRGAPLFTLIYPRRRLVLEPYYTRQNDSRSQPNHIHALGLTLNIYL